MAKNDNTNTFLAPFFIPGIQSQHCLSKTTKQGAIHKPHYSMSENGCEISQWDAIIIRNRQTI